MACNDTNDYMSGIIIPRVTIEMERKAIKYDRKIDDDDETTI